jgi:hypothetical protein
MSVERRFTDRYILRATESSTRGLKVSPRTAARACEWPSVCYTPDMTAIRASVKNGRLQLDEPTALPEGTVLDLVIDDEGDDLDVEERLALDASLRSALASVRAGRGQPLHDVLTELRRR